MPRTIETIRAAQRTKLTGDPPSGRRRMRGVRVERRVRAHRLVPQQRKAPPTE